MNQGISTNLPLHFSEDIVEMESRATNTLEMGGTCNHEDLNALVGYIQEVGMMCVSWVSQYLVETNIAVFCSSIFLASFYPLE